MDAPPALHPASAAPARDDEGRPDGGYAIRIARDGTWFYHGSPILRMPLVKLFAGVLQRDENGEYWLVTPVERGRIEVEDAPFLAVEVDARGEGRDQTLIFRTNLDQYVTADAKHPIRVTHDPLSGEPTPYILVRDRLEARISRAVFYQMVQFAAERTIAEGIELGVWSERIFFPLGTIPSP